MRWTLLKDNVKNKKECDKKWWTKLCIVMYSYRRVKKFAGAHICIFQVIV